MLIQRSLCIYTLVGTFWIAERRLRYMNLVPRGLPRRKHLPRHVQCYGHLVLEHGLGGGILWRPGSKLLAGEVECPAAVLKVFSSGGVGSR